MNFAGLWQAIQTFDEVMPIGKEIWEGGRLYHIAGMTRKGSKARMYVLSENVSEKRDVSFCVSTNRERMRREPESDFFMGIAALKIGKTELKTEGITGFILGLNVDYNCEELLLFAELMKAGWQLPENSKFIGKEWEEMWITHIDFDLSTSMQDIAASSGAASLFNAGELFDAAVPNDVTKAVNVAAQRLPCWENQEIFVQLGKRSRIYPVEKPVELIVNQSMEEVEIPFSLADGREGICYINRVYPMDVWRDNEERFKDPRYLEIMTEEELERQKEEFFAGLAEDCPKGMCYLAIEYECTLEGNLVFYDSAFLDALSKENKGSARVLMMLLKPDEPWGKHGFRQHGCVIQRPVLPDICRMEAELFSYVELLGEKEVQLRFEEVF